MAITIDCSEPFFSNYSTTSTIGDYPIDQAIDFLTSLLQSNSVFFVMVILGLIAAVLLTLISIRFIKKFILMRPRETHTRKKKQVINRPHSNHRRQRSTLSSIGTKAEHVRARDFAISGDWISVTASVSGAGHISRKIPCQDYCSIAKSKSKDGSDAIVTSVCDGAGSAYYSGLGSKFLAQLFTDMVIDVVLPVIDYEEIEKQSRVIKSLLLTCVYDARDAIDDYADSLGVSTRSLACTLICSIQICDSLITLNIGDGRGGALIAPQGKDSQWVATFTPYRGEEANETVFITSVQDKAGLRKFAEISIIPSDVCAFSILSDGCEKVAFECSRVDEETKEWSDPNLPHDKFFNPLLLQIKTMFEGGGSADEIATKWANFLMNGNTKLSEESDDKTMTLCLDLNHDLLPNAVTKNDKDRTYADKAADNAILDPSRQT